MIRLLLRLLKITDFEVCASCETLKQQLDLANIEKKELLEQLILLTKPNVIVPSEESKVLVNIPSAKGLFSRRKSILEENERRRVEITKHSPFIAKASVPSETVQHITPQSVEALEAKLGIVDSNEEEQLNAG